MEEWKEFKVGDIFHIQNGYAFKSGEFVDNSEDTYEVLKIGHIEVGGGLRSDPKRTYVKRSDKFKKWVLEKNDIVMGMTDMKSNVVILGIPALVDKDDTYVLNQRVARLSLIDSNSFDIYFCYYQMLWNEFTSELRKTANSGVQVNLTTSGISNTILYVPKIETQKEIGRVLRALDDKIECNRRINENLEQQAQALFKSWFVDFEPFKDQPFVESELGMIPQGWKVITLSDACEKVTDGSHYSPKDDPFGTIPMLSVKDMTHNCFDYSSCKKINEEEYEKMKVNDCVPRVNDILVAKDGSYLKEIFMCNEEIKQAILSSIAIFRSNIDVIFPEILLQLLRLPKVKKDVGDNYVSGSALPRIVLKDFKKFKFVVAPIEIQNEIIESLRSVNARIHINEKESRRLAELRDTLLPKLMSGELKVGEINV